MGPRRLAFTSETFILSFSLRNFHFHAVTAYDILRSQGVPLGKRVYEGRLRSGIGGGGSWCSTRPCVAKTKPYRISRAWI